MAIIKCPYCGGMVSDQAPSCPHCGASLSQGYTPVQPPFQSYPTSKPIDKPDTGMNVLSFFFPYIGWILYFIYREQTPIKAKACAKNGWIGFAIWIILTIVLVAIAVALEDY